MNCITACSFASSTWIPGGRPSGTSNSRKSSSLVAKSNLSTSFCRCNGIAAIVPETTKLAANQHKIPIKTAKIAPSKFKSAGTVPSFCTDGNMPTSVALTIAAKKEMTSIAEFHWFGASTRCGIGRLSCMMILRMSPRSSRKLLTKEKMTPSGMPREKRAT